MTVAERPPPRASSHASPLALHLLKTPQLTAPGLCVAHLIGGAGSNMKSPTIKVCADIDAPLAAGLSQRPRPRGGEERWAEVTRGDAGCWRPTCSVAVMAAGNRGVIAMVSDAPSSSRSADLNSAGSLEWTPFFFPVKQPCRFIKLLTNCRQHACSPETIYICH